MQNNKTIQLTERYEALSILGRGGMGEVHRVFDRLLGRSVAMKLISTKYVDEDALARFVEEAQVSARLQHPNILPVHDFGRLPDGRLFFTMKIAEGDSLDKHIQQLHAHSDQNGWASEGEIYSLRRLLSGFKQVCDAVAYAHSRGVIHRDLKPMNIIIGEHGSIQLLDWGIAKRLETYHSQWANDIAGQFELQLTPSHEILNSHPSGSQSNSHGQAQSNSGVTEVTMTTLYGDDENDPRPPSFASFGNGPSRFSDVLGETYHHPEFSSRPSLESIPRFPLRRDKLSTSATPELPFGHLDTPEHEFIQPSRLAVGTDLGDLQRFSISAEQLISHQFSSHTSQTSQVAVAGTLSYMAPEQLKGESELISYQTDVYGLGVVLFELLTGTIPFRLGRESQRSSSLREKIDQALELRFEEVTWPEDMPPLPVKLKEICEKALHPEIERRFSSASELSEALVHFLDGVGRRDQAMTKVEEAEGLFEQAKVLKTQADQQFLEGKALESTLKSSDSEELKRPVWSILDQAIALIEEASILEEEGERALHDALIFDSEFPEAHGQLALRVLASHKEAEHKQSMGEMRRLVRLLRAHLKYSPPSIQNQIERYLSEVGPLHLTAISDTGAPVFVKARRYGERSRRLVLGEEEDWGVTPIQREVPLGSYLLVLEAEGCEPVRYPIFIERERGWQTGLSADEPLPIRVPVSGLIPQGFKYVPAGWCYVGGDELVSNSVSLRRRIWVESFAMAESHITHREYLDFLNDLLKRGEPARAHDLRARLRDEEGEGLYTLSEGRYVLNENYFAQLDWPANYTDYECAIEYARWRSENEKRAYRLPSDTEWEKAARGVDGRFFPWGNSFDPSFVHMRQSTISPQPGISSHWPIDQSPWGHFALSGSMRDWTCTLFTETFPYQDGSVAPPPQAHEIDDLTTDHVVRGGSWKTQEGNCRVAFRFVSSPKYRDDDGGFRLAFSLPSTPQTSST